MTDQFVTPAGSATPDALQDVVQRFSGGYRSVGTMVYEVLRDAILTGALAPGQRLRQEMLAETIGVSRLPIRSALIQLESEGLVQFHERRGAVVKTLTRSQVAEIYDLRIVLEEFALRRAAASMTPARLTALLELARDADAQHEGAQFRAAREALYRELYEADEYPLLWQALDDLKTKVGGYLLGRRIGEGHGGSHVRLVEALAQDTEQAVALLSEHLRAVRVGVTALVESGDAVDEAD